MRAISAVALALLGLPWLIGDYWSYQLALYYLYAIAALGVGLCWGRAGFLPLGQGLFFGLSAYVSGWALINLQNKWWLLLWLPAAVVVSGALALAIGVLVFRRRGESGPYFSMITLALALLAFQLANNWEGLTGGFNGMKGIPGLPGLDGYTESYYVAAVALLIALAVYAWLRAAPLGVLWSAIAGNERRVMLLGFDTNRLKAVAFGVSGLFAGLGGALYAPQQGLVTPQLCGFVLSADLVIWTAVGGRTQWLGPVVGALLVGALTSELRNRIQWWEILVAALFIAVVLLFPQGLSGAAVPIKRLWARTRRARRASPPAAAPQPGATPQRATAASGEPDATTAAESRPTDSTELTIDGIDVAIGSIDILRGLSLRFDRPGIYCVIGPNGAGKTSMFNMLTGELSAQAGSVQFNGRRLTNLAPQRVIANGLGRKLQIPSVFTDLSIADNLALALWGHRLRRSQALRPAQRRRSSAALSVLQRRYPFLADPSRSAAELSHGERQILELAMAILGEPRVLLLDEPCAGLSPQETAQVIDVIRWVRQAQQSIVIVIEHDMALVKTLADHVFVLHNGAVLAQGSVAAVQADDAVRAVYVGAEK